MDDARDVTMSAAEPLAMVGVDTTCGTATVDRPLRSVPCALVEAETEPDADMLPLETNSAPAEPLRLATGDLRLHDASTEDFSADAGPTADVPLGRIVEALLFGSDVPLSPGKLAELAGVRSPTVVRLEIASLNEKYALAGLTFRIEEIAGGYRMMTLPQYQPWLARLHKHAQQTRLSDAALETLSIVAYKQPIIRADVEAIRGVACGDVINRLKDMALIKIVGRAEIVGRPLLYGTTRRFLDAFGLSDLSDLPPMEALALGKARPAVAESAPPPVEPALRTAVAGA